MYSARAASLDAQLQGEDADAEVQAEAYAATLEAEAAQLEAEAARLEGGADEAAAETHNHAGESLGEFKVKVLVQPAGTDLETGIATNGILHEY